jgi:putative transcriptional regulator
MQHVVENKVYALRTEHAMTQEMLAERVGVSRQTIIAIEKGSYTPSVALALKLGHAFGVPVETIFTLRRTTK